MSRVIYITGEIDNNTYKEFANKLDIYRAQGKEPVKLVINSEGGSVYNALAVAGLITSTDVIIKGYVVGCCMSAATLIYAACDERYVSKLAWFFFHTGAFKNKGELTDRLQELEQETREHEAQYLFLEERTGTSRAIWKQYELDKRYLNATQAFKCNLAQYKME